MIWLKKNKRREELIYIIRGVEREREKERSFWEKSRWKLGVCMVVFFFLKIYPSFLKFEWKEKKKEMRWLWASVFGSKLTSQLILPFNLISLLFMNPIALFGTIYESHYTISANFYLYLKYFQQKVFSFNKINGSQTNP